MTPLWAGLLLPASVLSSTWFLVMATIVAFNTIIYIGLTLSKLVPMPQQFHPERVRSALTMVGIHPTDKAARRTIHAKDLATDDPFDLLRTSIVKRDLPLAFGFLGTTIILVSISAMLLLGNDRLANSLLELLMGILLLILGQLAGARTVRVSAARWLWCFATVAVVVVLVQESLAIDSEVPLGVALVVMTAFAPVVLAWRPTIITAIVLALVAVLPVTDMTPSESARFLIATLAALLVSCMLLFLRTSALKQLADERVRSEAIASTDPLTGVLTENGLRSLMPSLGAIAERSGESICVMVFHIKGLQQARHDYGTDYANAVLEGVAKAISNGVRLGDLTSRWDKSCYVVAGIGSRPDTAVIAQRISRQIDTIGIALGKWPVTLRVGTAAGQPSETTFTDLLAEASQQAFANE